MSISKRVFLQRPEPKQETIEAFQEISTAIVADAMGRINAIHPRIRRMNCKEGKIVAGPALTVRCRAGDNMLLQKALDMAKPGDVIVVGCERQENRAMMGEVLYQYACRTQKIGAIILDAPMRDIQGLAGIDMPVYATGTSPLGPFRDAVGEVNGPVNCGDLTVCPGDIVVCDLDGIVVVPLDEAEGILLEAQKMAIKDVEKTQKVLNGTYKRDFVDKTLQEKNVEIINGMWK